MQQVKKLLRDNRLPMIVDKELNKYDSVEMEEMVHVALLCTRYNPSERPKMSEILRLLEGEGLVNKWEASNKIGDSKSEQNDSHLSLQEERSINYTNLVDIRSLDIEEIELSGPR